MTWVVIMAGGLGSRFWPISRTDKPKQFLDVMGVGLSMLQLTFQRFSKVCPRENIIVVTGEQFVDRVREQLPDLAPYQVLGEPLRRNTAPCIAYAAAMIHNMDHDATIVVSPSDHAIFHEDLFLSDLRQAIDTAAHHDWIITLGAQPSRPDTSYGYIQFDHKTSLPSSPNMHPVVTFTEKPPVEMARQFIASGEFLWNTGLLVWRLPVLTAAFNEHLPAVAEAFRHVTAETPYESLEQIYSLCDAVSVDNGIMEKAANVHVLEAAFGWSDVETWGTLYDVAQHDGNGNATIRGELMAYNSHDCLVVMPPDSKMTVVLEGLDGYIVAAGSDTLMVCRRNNEDMVFKFASDIELKHLMKGTL